MPVVKWTRILLFIVSSTAHGHGLQYQRAKRSKPLKTDLRELTGLPANGFQTPLANTPIINPISVPLGV